MSGLCAVRRRLPAARPRDRRRRGQEPRGRPRRRRGLRRHRGGPAQVGVGGGKLRRGALRPRAGGCWKCGGRRRRGRGGRLRGERRATRRQNTACRFEKRTDLPRRGRRVGRTQAETAAGLRHDQCGGGRGVEAGGVKRRRRRGLGARAQARAAPRAVTGAVRRRVRRKSGGRRLQRDPDDLLEFATAEVPAGGRGLAQAKHVPRIVGKRRARVPRAVRPRGPAPFYNICDRGGLRRGGRG